MLQFLKDTEVLSEGPEAEVLPVYFMGSDCQDAHLAPRLTFC